ncbi:MAG: hypothetical protein SFU91_09370 [Chloroherpetonaceae bacterium]|nr:hypothetical protein [Chloroherpetonaceae bacterium]
MLTKILTERHILGLTLWSYLESNDRKSPVFSEVFSENNSQIELLQSFASENTLATVTQNIRQFAENAPLTPRTEKEVMQLVLDKEFEIMRLTEELMMHPDTSVFVLRNIRYAAKSHKLFVEELSEKATSSF